jgi:hypothetical protein
MCRVCRRMTLPLQIKSIMEYITYKSYLMIEISDELSKKLLPPFLNILNI